MQADDGKFYLSHLRVGDAYTLPDHCVRIVVAVHAETFDFLYFHDDGVRFETSPRFGYNHWLETEDLTLIRTSDG